MENSFPNARQTRANDRANDHATSNGEPVDLELDALIIGAGFAGVYLLHKLRQEGFNAKIVEAGSGLGGVWHWSNYPGARVDSQYPVYALSIPEVFNTWEWTEQYPGAKELQRYFKHVDQVLDISKDTLYHTRVTTARWDDSLHKWHVQCDNGTKITTSYIHCCLGFAAKRHLPDWPGLDDFAGQIYHSSFWPEEGVEMTGKRFGIVGQGATGVQIAQEAAKEASTLTVFIRTPNICFPMNQGKIEKAQIKKDLEEYVPRALQKERFSNIGGFLYPFNNQSFFDDDPSERQRRVEEAFRLGGFRILFAYNDIIVDEKANRAVYDLWASRTRSRISDPVKRDILAPLEPPHFFGAKRNSLEQDYYEQMDKDHIRLVDLKKVAISRVTRDGIVTSDGNEHKLDVLALATGFDSLTGSFDLVKFSGLQEKTLQEKWSTDQGALAYLGLAVAGFPNMFYTYGPLSPSAYGNGPSMVESQSDWITETMKKMKKDGKTKINAKESYELDWKKMVEGMHSMTLRHTADSWYMGTNIPGKPRQALIYAAGLPLYIETLQKCLDNGMEGFELS